MPTQRIHALKHPDTAWEVARYAIVGALGFAVSVAVFALADWAGAGYILAATIAFIAALLHNFAWNRHWTFKAGDGRLHVQWLRFLVVNVAVFLFSLVVLHLLIAEAGVGRVTAQAIAVAAAAPPNFLGQKLWSFFD